MTGALKKILVTGGAGYIGSHTCVELLAAGYGVSVLDNLCNSSEECLKRVEEISGRKVAFHKVDLLDEDKVEAVFKEEKPDAVIHFAGLKAVGESCSIPLRYYHNNLTGTLNLLRVMERHSCWNLVFSSSATVYGDPPRLPIEESFPLSATNPYGRTKLMIEDMLRDLAKADARWRLCMLRYFNPVGAHVSGRIGEDPEQPNNLMPYIQQVAIGRRPHLNVFGNDYNTRDGTGVRDYIHVVDLAQGHLAALGRLAVFKKEDPGCCLVYNLGTGNGISVLEMVEAMRKATGRPIEVKICERRSGDVAACYADASLAKRELHWEAKLGLTEMCRDAWNWQRKNPQGFRGPPASD
eukprot:tig00000241_g20864.t1